jgi:hypothetical protein
LTGHPDIGLAPIASRHPAVGLAVGVVRGGRLRHFHGHGLARHRLAHTGDREHGVPDRFPGLPAALHLGLDSLDASLKLRLVVERGHHHMPPLPPFGVIAVVMPIKRSMASSPGSTRGTRQR